MIRFSIQKGGFIMQITMPGSALKIDGARAEAADELLSSLFAGGGLVLSQAAKVTGLEPYRIQNWVARGFLSAPEGKRYTRRQLSRILIINMLRSALPLPEICRLLRFINGDLGDESDDAIDDSRLYLYFVRLYREPGQDLETLTADYAEPFPGAAKRLGQALCIMEKAYRSSELRREAMDLIAGLEA